MKHGANGCWIDGLFCFRTHSVTKVAMKQARPICRLLAGLQCAFVSQCIPRTELCLDAHDQLPVHDEHDVRLGLEVMDVAFQRLSNVLKPLVAPPPAISDIYEFAP